MVLCPGTSPALRSPIVRAVFERLNPGLSVVCKQSPSFCNLDGAPRVAVCGSFLRADAAEPAWHCWFFLSLGQNGKIWKLNVWVGTSRGRGNKSTKSLGHVEAICYSSRRLHLSERVQKQYELESDGIWTCKHPTIIHVKVRVPAWNPIWPVPFNYSDAEQCCRSCFCIWPRFLNLPSMNWRSLKKAAQDVFIKGTYRG